MALYNEIFVWSLNKVPFSHAANLVCKGFLVLERLLAELAPVLIGVDIAFGNRDMLNHRRAEHDIKLLVIERQPPTLWQQNRVKPALGGFLQRAWVYIGNPDVPMFRQDSSDMRAIVPAQVENLVLW
jgi:hypothetical protein